MERIDYLVAAHPLLFPGVPPQSFSDLPAGWYHLTDRVCFGIELAVLHEKGQV